MEALVASVPDKEDVSFGNIEVTKPNRVKRGELLKS